MVKNVVVGLPFSAFSLFVSFLIAQGTHCKSIAAMLPSLFLLQQDAATTSKGEKRKTRTSNTCGAFCLQRVR